MMSKTKNLVIIGLLLGIQMLFGATLLYEDFEGSTFPPTGWDTVKTGTCRVWVRRTSGQVFRIGASAGILIASDASTGGLTGTSYLRTPSLNFNSSSIESLSFYFRCPGSGTAYGLASSLDTIKVEVSTNLIDWSSVLVIDSNYIRDLPRQPAVRDTGYKLVVDLRDYNGQPNVYIRWILYDNYSGTVETNRYFNIDSVYVYDQTPVGNQPPIITSVTRIPFTPSPNEPVIIKAKIYDDSTSLSNIACSLRYVVDPTTDTIWISVSKDSMRTSDSTFYFTIPGQSAYNKVCYHIWAQDTASPPASTRTTTYSYTITVPPTVMILTRPRYVQGGATTGTPGTGTPFVIYAGVKPGADNDSFYYKGRIGSSGLTWNVTGNVWAADNASWASLSKILCGSVNETTKIWVAMKARPSATVDTVLTFRVRHIPSENMTDSPVDTIKILKMTSDGDGGWLYGHIYESNTGPVRENVVVLAYQGQEIVGAYITENNNINEGYSSTDAGYIRMAVKAGLIDSLQVRDRTTNERLAFYTQIPGPWMVYPGDSTNLDIEQAPIIRNISRNPSVPLYNEEVTVSAKIYDHQSGLNVFDTLLCALNTPTDWQGVSRSSYNPQDSIFTYVIPANFANQGDTVFYKLHIWDGDGNFTASQMFRYTIPLNRTVTQIQNYGPATADSNKYVATRGLVTGNIGTRFFIEEQPGGAWHGIYIYRRAQDSIPRLNVGDSVVVVGIAKEYNTLTEIDAGYNLNGDVRVLANNRSLPCTTRLSFGGIAEDYEGCLVRLDSVFFKAVGNFAGGTNYWLYSLNSNDSVRVRIDAAVSQIVNQPIPQDTFALIANLGAFKDTFQLMPRAMSDFLSYYLDLAITEILSPSGTVPQNSTVRPKAKVKNLGSLAAPAFRVVFNIAEQKQSTYTDTVDISGLGIGQEVTVEFRGYQVTGAIGATYSTEAKVLIDNDRYPLNNTITGGGFEVGPPIVSQWTQLADVPQAPDLKSGKYVKDGGALVATNNVLFAFPGNKSCRFFKYTPGTGWAEVESIPYAYKYKPGQPIDSTTVNKKKVAKGASLCWDGENFIYATKGNGTYEFWKYDILNDTWILLPYVPTTKGLKGGTSIAYHDGYVYLLAGGQKQATHEFFFRYSVTDNTWQTLAKPVIGVKDWKDGSAIAAYGNKVYAMKGGDKPNYFLTYDITGSSWNIGSYETLTTFDSVLTGTKWATKKYYVKDGGALTYGDGYLYALKGAGIPLLYRYTIGSANSWVQYETIPRLHNKSVPKTGAALAYLNSAVYLMKGNNLQEFWSYGPLGAKRAQAINVTPIAQLMSETRGSLLANELLKVLSNPVTKNIIVRYEVQISGKGSLRLYDAAGRLITTLYEGTLNSGSYEMTIDRRALACGVYFLRYEINGQRSEAKLLVE